MPRHTAAAPPSTAVRQNSAALDFDSLLRPQFKFLKLRNKTMAAKVHATLQQHGSVAPGGMPTRSSKRASKLATRLEKLDTHPDRTTEQDGRARPECIFLATDSAAIAAAAVSEVLEGFEVLMLREDLQTTVAMDYHSSPHTD